MLLCEKFNIFGTILHFTRIGQVYRRRDNKNILVFSRFTVPISVHVQNEMAKFHKVV